MKSFLIKTLNVGIVVILIVGYNMFIEIRNQNETIAKLNAQVASIASDEVGGTIYQDGEYSGQADGFGGTIEVKVTVSKKKISKIDVVSASGEDGAYLSMAKDIINNIIEQQSIDVDTVSGATFSSTGIRNAVKSALEKASK